MQDNVLSSVGKHPVGKHIGSMPQLTQDTVPALHGCVVESHVDIDFASDWALPDSRHWILRARVE